MLRKYLARQKQLQDYMALSDHRSIGCSSVTASVDEFSHSRCLNDTCKAITAKSEAERKLPSIGLLLTQLVLYYQSEECFSLESDTEKIISLAGSVPTF